MGQERWTVSVPGAAGVSVVLDHPDPSLSLDRGAAVVLAHGAGNDLETPLLRDFARGLAVEGFAVVRFNFPYRQIGQRAPDRPAVLESTWRAVWDAMRRHPRVRGRAVIVGGKSMGGRIASYLVVNGGVPSPGLLLLGYPLHPAGKKDLLRDEHLYRLSVPSLFFAGTRDALCDLSLLKGVLARMPGPVDLAVVQGGDHSFKVPKSTGVPQEQIHAGMIARTALWLQCFEGGPGER